MHALSGDLGWGKEAGESLPIAYIGIFISGILLPLPGYIALVKGRGNFCDISTRPAPRFGMVFAAITIIVLGPAYIVPRMSAAAWSAILQLTGASLDGTAPIIVFTVIYYIVIYWFVSSSGRVVSRVGRTLFPVLVIIVIAVIVKSLVTPLSDGWTRPSFEENPLIYGVLRGYATGDLQCALMFGLIVVQGIRGAGISEEAVNKNLLRVGAVGLGMLALTHLGHMISGANLGGKIDLTLSALYTEMVLRLWGRAGGALFTVALTAAALTTAIGCISSTAEIWEKIFGGKYSYKLICAASCLLSCGMSVAGLDKIVTFVGPILDACYPAAIVLSFYYCFEKRRFENKRLNALKWSMAAAFIMGFLDAFTVYAGLLGINAEKFERVYHLLPLAKYSLAWVPLCVLIFIAALFLSGSMKGSAETVSRIA